MYVTLMPIEKMGTMAVDILLDNIASKEDYRPQGVVLENTILS